MQRLESAVALGLIVFGATAIATAAVPEPQVALVIGSDGYRDAPLKNPTNDAHLMTETPRGFGFQVIKRTDVDQRGIRRLIRDFGEALDDVFSLQDQVTRKIIEVLALNLTLGESDRQRRMKTDNPEAYDAFLQGWEYYRRFTADDFVKAIPYFERAVDLDPDYGRAYAALAAVYWRSNGHWASWVDGRDWAAKVNPADNNYLSFKGAREKAEKLLELAMRDPTPLAHQIASAMQLDYRQFDRGLVEAERALAFDPNDPESHLAIARALIAAGRAQEAIAAVEKGARLNPHHPAGYLSTLGAAYLFAGQDQEAVAALERGFRRNPELFGIQALLAVTYVNLDRFQDAQFALKMYTDAWTQYLPKVDRVMKYWPFQREVDVRRFGGGLVKAGLCCAEHLEAYIELVRAGGTLE